MHEKLKMIVQAIQSNLYSHSFKMAVISSLFWGIVAHAYGFLHGSLTHDSLDAINAAEGDNRWKIALGRVLVPLYHSLTRGDVALPWMIGVLAIIYITIAVFLVTKIFKIRSKLFIFIVAGIFVANNTVTATAATYIHDFDQNMLALLCSVVSVYLWQRFPKGFLVAMIPIGISVALYQAYISVAVTLVLMILILNLLDGENVKSVVLKGIKAIGMCVGGGVVYLLIMKLVLLITAVDIHSGGYNSVDSVSSMSFSRFVFCLVKGYWQSCRQFVDVVSAYNRLFNVALHLFLLSIVAICILPKLCSKKLTLGAKLLVLILLGVFPVGVNVVYPLTGGMSHDLMHFAIWLIYLLVLLMVLKNTTCRKSPLWLMAISVLFVILLGNVQIANLAYLKKDYVSRTGDAYFTRLLGRIELVDGYKPGITPVVFVGKPELLCDDISTFQKVKRLTGVGDTFILGVNGRNRYVSYFTKMLCHKIVIATNDIWQAMQTDYQVATMPAYPSDGCVKMFGDVLVIKQGQTKLEEFCPDMSRALECCTDNYQLPHVEGWYADPNADVLICPIQNLSSLGVKAGDKVVVKPTYTNLPPPLSLYQRCMNSLLSIPSPVLEMRNAQPLSGYAIQTPQGAYILVRHNREIPRASIVALCIEKASK